jgi:hypothetical protein
MLAFIIAWIAIISFFVTAAYEEGGNAGTGVLYYVCKWALIVIAYPIYLLANIIPFQRMWIFIFVIILDVIIYSLLIEILLIKYQTYKIARAAKIRN